MNKSIFTLYRNLSDINAYSCCLCYNYVNEETAYVQDFVVLSLNNDYDSKKCSNYQEVGIHYLLQQILGSEVAAYLSGTDHICDKCTQSAINSYKFIKMCRDNIKRMADSVEAFTSNINLTEVEGMDLQDYKTMYMIMDFEESKYTQYYDTAKFTDSKAALYKFQTLFRPFRPIKDKKCNTKYKCTKCQSVFLNPMNALKHFNRKHIEDQELCLKDKMKNCVSDSEDDNYICAADVNEESSAPTELHNSDNVRHLNELSHEVIKDCDGVNKYKCTECNSIFLNVNCARRHYNKNHVPKLETEKSVSSNYDLKKDINVVKKGACHDKLVNNKTKTKKQIPEFLTKFNYCRDNIKHLNELSHTVTKMPDGKIKYRCRECTSVFSHQPNARRHYLKYHVEEIKFEAESVIEDNIITEKKSKINNADYKFMCSYCNGNYDSKYVLIEHILKEHADKNIESCETTLEDIHLLENGIYNHIYTKFMDENGCDKFCCKLCLKLFKNFQTVRNHFNNTHVKPPVDQEDQYICSQCGKVSKTKSLLNKHEERHTDSKVTCEICNKEFKNKHSLREHKSTMQGECVLHYKERVITKTKKKIPDFLTKFNYCRDNIKHLNELSHTVSMMPDGKIKCMCRECTSVFSNQHSARSHYLKCHVEETKFEAEAVIEDNIIIETNTKKNNAEDKFMCSYCSEIYDNKYVLIEHILKQHADKNIESSETTLEDIHLLENDIYNHIYTIVIDENGCDRFCCKLCLKLFKNFQIVRNHFNNTHVKPLVDQEDQYICSQCGKVFKTKFLLNKHEERHTDSKVTCEICNKEFKNKSSLRDHKNNMQGGCLLTFKERPVTKRKNKSDIVLYCDNCENTYTNKHSLRSHMKNSHDPTAKKFPCIYCPKVFCYRSHLKSHEVTHTGERNFTCNICGDVFCAKNALVYHTRIHTGERPYQCSYCDMRFLSASRRADHVNRHHISEMAVCPVCGITIKQAGMRKHRSRHLKHSSKEAGSNLSLVSGKGKGKAKVTVARNE